MMPLHHNIPSITHDAISRHYPPSVFFILALRFLLGGNRRSRVPSTVG
jgi:hypothetical protein